MDDALKAVRRPSPQLLELLLLVLLIALPQLPFMDRSRTSLAVFAGIYIMLGLSLNVIVGYAGLFQLGHAAFFGLGAYTAAVLSIDYGVTILATIPIAALVAGGAAVLITKPILHLRGDYLCIVTIAFGEIFRIAVTNNIFGITGGSNGLVGAGRPEFPLPWLEPIPALTLAALLALHLFSTRRQGRVVQWGGAALLGLAFYLTPLALDRQPLFLGSIVMVASALVVGAVLRSRGVNGRGQLAGLAAVVLVFVFAMAAQADPLVTGIERNLDEYFRVQEPTTVLGVEVTPVTFKRDARPYYYLVLGFIVLTVIGMRRLQNSRIGRAWLYVREDQLAAEAMGIDATHVKLVAFAIGAAWAGVAGVLYASRFTVVAPESFNFLQSVIMFSIVVLGGSGSIPGVFVGTLGMVVLPELLRDVAPTFLYDGATPLIFVALLLALHIHQSQRRLPVALAESGAIALAFFLPPLILNRPALFVLSTVMAVIAIWAVPRVHRRAANALPWIVGGLGVYTAVLLVAGRSIAPALEDVVLSFRIMDWRDGLMGAAMILMMILRPAGLIPEQRRGIAIPETPAPREVLPAPAAQRTI